VNKSGGISADIRKVVPDTTRAYKRSYFDSKEVLFPI
jgi:hypothetical protein